MLLHELDWSTTVCTLSQNRKDSGLSVGCDCVSWYRDIFASCVIATNGPVRVFCLSSPPWKVYLITRSSQAFLPDFWSFSSYLPCLTIGRSWKLGGRAGGLHCTARSRPFWFVLRGQPERNFCYCNKFFFRFSLLRGHERRSEEERLISTSMVIRLRPVDELVVIVVCFHN